MNTFTKIWIICLSAFVLGAFSWLAVLSLQKPAPDNSAEVMELKLQSAKVAQSEIEMRKDIAKILTTVEASRLREDSLNRAGKIMIQQLSAYEKRLKEMQIHIPKTHFQDSSKQAIKNNLPK